MHVHSKHEIKVREYRGLAQAATDAALNATLGHVRLKYEGAANAWAELAFNEEARMSRPTALRHAPAIRMKAMTNDQKLAAIEDGVVGSYNFAAPRTSDPFAAMGFQHVAAQALGIASGRGYFYRRAMDGSHVDGLLITIGLETSPDASEVAASHDRPAIADWVS